MYVCGGLPQRVWGTSLPWMVLGTYSSPPSLPLSPASALLPPLFSPAPPPSFPCSRLGLATQCSGPGGGCHQVGGVLCLSGLQPSSLTETSRCHTFGLLRFSSLHCFPLSWWLSPRCWGSPASDGHASEPGPQPVALALASIFRLLCV